MSSEKYAKLQDALDWLGLPEHRRDLYIPFTLLDELEARAPSKYYSSFTARDVVQNPEAIAMGPRFDGEGNPWCVTYVGRPATIRTATGTEPLPPGYVFCVFSSLSGHVYEWGLEEADPHTPDLPRDKDRQRFPGGFTWRKSD